MYARMKKYDKITAKQLFYAHLRTVCAGTGISSYAAEDGNGLYLTINFIHGLAISLFALSFYENCVVKEAFRGERFMRIKLIAIAMLAMFLTGCTSNSVEDVLRVPALPSEFMEFNDELNKIKASGMEPIAPNSGTNRQSIQLTDLDGDGVDEGIAFFRETSNTYKVYACIFRRLMTDTKRVRGSRALEMQLKM